MTPRPRRPGRRARSRDTGPVPLPPSLVGGSRRSVRDRCRWRSTSRRRGQQRLAAQLAQEFVQHVVDHRQRQGLTVDAKFIGISDMTLAAAEFDEVTKEGEVSIRFKSEMTSIVRDKGGDIIEGNEKEIKRQKDTWTFSRKMDSSDPNWRLVATGE